jgi:shikimate dehydrogenase
VSEHPYLVGLIGAGVGPSLTPPLHMAAARQLGLTYVYRAIDVAALHPDRAGLHDLVRAAQSLGFDALNITHPFKQAVIEYLDRLDERAARLGAVNTVIFEGGEATGYNTDSSGFATAFREGLPGAAVREVVQLGAGGAGRAVADALLSHGTEHLSIVDTDEARSGKLAHDLGIRFPLARVDSAPADKLSVLLPETDGLVHCTPTGMREHPGLPLNPGLLHSGLWIADIVYRPLDTPLLKAARKVGCRTLDGGQMAVHQAVDTFTLVTGVTPDVERMLATFHDLVSHEPA